jgi:PmbA protein
VSAVDEREADLLALVHSVVGRAADGEALEAFATHRLGTSVTVFSGEVERLTSSESRGIGVRIVVGNRLGFAATADVTAEGLADVVAEARSNAELGSPDPGNVLPQPPADAPAPIDGLVVPALADVPAARKVALALEVERMATGLDRRVTRAQSAGYGDAIVSVAIASTTGVAASYSRSHAMTYVVSMARDGDDTQTGVGVTDGRTIDDLDVESAARDGVTRAGGRGAPSRRAEAGDGHGSCCLRPDGHLRVP